jgi:GNAT superfamily N-acetyltransferase
MPPRSPEPDPTIEVVTVEGLRTVVPQGRAWTHSALVFRPYVPGWPRGGVVSTTCGEVFDAAFSVLSSAPPILSSAACARHLTFLEHLSRCTYESLERAFRLTGPLGNDSVDRLGIVLSLWVEHFLHDRDKVVHPLAASWALDTAVVLTDLVCGDRLYTSDNEPWEVQGLIDGSDELRNRLKSNRLDSAQMKREVTMRLGRTSVLVRVPSTGKVVPLGRGEPVIFGPGELLVARIQRCHLSSGVADYSQYECVDSARLKYDLDERFQFRCGLVPVRVKKPAPGSPEVTLAPDESMLDPLEVARGYMPFGEIPGDWIVSVMEEEFGDPVGRLQPMPWKPVGTDANSALQSEIGRTGISTALPPSVERSGSLGSTAKPEEEMPGLSPSDDDVSFSIELQVEAPLSYSEEADYISKIDGTIFANATLPDGSPAPPVKVGSIDAIRIYGGRAMNERWNLWDVCDAYEQTTADAYQVLFSERYEFAPVIQELFPDAMSPDVLIIDLVRVDPAYRGRGLGLLAARRVMDVFEPDDGLVLVKPFPLQFNAHQRSAVAKDTDLAAFTCDEKTAFKKLRKHWERLGFRRIPKTEYYALSPAVVTPSMRDLDPQ